MSTSPPLNNGSDHVDVVNILKRRCEALEDQVAHASHPERKNTTQAQIYSGRPVRRVVSLFDNIPDLVGENDRRLLLLEAEDGDEADGNHTIEQDRLLRGYQQLIRFLPSLKNTVVEANNTELNTFYANVRRGSDMARGDDSGSLKSIIVEWVNDIFGPSVPPLRPKVKEGRGLDHEFCGRLLCPAEYDWGDATIQANIRDGHPDYAVTALSWPLFLYAGFKVQLDDMEEGLFQSELLVKAYKHIFTSPTSVTLDEEIPESVVRRTKRRNTGMASKKSPVASLINMDSVNPRSIAYIAVQLRFALSSLNTWNEVDIDFNHRHFYHAIVDYFEVTPGPIAQQHIAELLRWWNKRVFGNRAKRVDQLAEINPNSSVSKLSAQRAAKERVD